MVDVWAALVSAQLLAKTDVRTIISVLRAALMFVRDVTTHFSLARGLEDEQHNDN